jgi:quinol monooxygenase YgiN
MYSIQLHITVPPDRRLDVIGTIRPVIEPTLAIPGCRVCALFSDVSHDERFLFMEEWTNKDGFEAHIRSRSFDNVLSCMDMASGKPRLRICSAEASSGLEEVARIRSL